MASKESKGGELTNEQIEQDNKVKGKTGSLQGGYRGSQDTGDTKVRDLGTNVQRNDGIANDGSKRENEQI